MLLLDNCEHLVDACAAVVNTLLPACPHLWVLATSREPLAIAGEAVLRVPPLALPPATHPEDLRDLLASDAVQLFVARARRAAVLCADDPHRARRRADLRPSGRPAAGAGARRRPRAR